MPWKLGKILVRDATCPDTLAPSYSEFLSGELGAVADRAVSKKLHKNVNITILSPSRD